MPKSATPSYLPLNERFKSTKVVIAMAPRVARFDFLREALQSIVTIITLDTFHSTIVVGHSLGVIYYLQEKLLIICHPR
jgi:hypothetical protein